VVTNSSEASSAWAALSRLSPDTMRALAQATELAAATAERDRLRALFDAAGQGEHNVLSLVDHYQASALEAEGKLRRARELLKANGCDCGCDCDTDGHGAECEPCLACRIGEAVSK
jgi:hypothetical protein